MVENYRVLCTVAVLMKDELARVLMYGRQQLQFYVKLSYYNFFSKLLCRLSVLVVIFNLLNLKNFNEMHLKWFLLKKIKYF